MVPQRSETNRVWAQFSLKRATGKPETMGDTWFLLVQGPPGTWRIDDSYQDYDPRQPGEGP